MTSTQVPTVDLAPGMPSRVVVISATDITEGGRSLEGQTVTFALSDSLDVTAFGDVIAKTQATVTLDSAGGGTIRLPVYDENVKTWCGQDWAILVSTSWGSRKAIRVTAGTVPVALSALPNIRPLSRREQQWAITGVSLNVTTGTDPGVSSGTATLNGGVLGLNLVLPPTGPHTHGQIENGNGYWSMTAEGGVQLVAGGTEKFAISPAGVVTAGTFPSLTGYGSPQGVVYAGEGAIYTETAVPTSDYFKRIQWVKKTGSFTAAGWDVIHGFLERDIRSLASNVNADATIRLAIKDGWTGIRVDNLKPQTSGTAVEIFPSSGPLANYAPVATFQDIVTYGSLGATRTVQMNSAGRFAIFQASASDVLSGTLWWPRARDLPTAWIGGTA